MLEQKQDATQKNLEQTQKKLEQTHAELEATRNRLDEVTKEHSATKQKINLKMPQCIPVLRDIA